MKNKKASNKNDTSTKAKAKKVSTRKTPKALTKGIYNGIEYESVDELNILQWLFELKAYGYIKSIKRAESYLLSDPLNTTYVEQVKKVSSKVITQNHLRAHSYTPEFEVIWSKKALDRFIWVFGSPNKFDKLFIAHLVSKDERGEFDLITYMEVKPSFDQNNMTRAFVINQKWMWDKHKIYVNLLKVKDLFPKTFTPLEYLTTPTGRPKVINWNPKTLGNYLNDK